MTVQAQVESLEDDVIDAEPDAQAKQDKYGLTGKDIH